MAYQAVYLKVHQPVTYFAAVLNAGGGYYDLPEYVAEAKRNGLRILGPDANRSGAGFAVENGAIRVGLTSIKGLGLKTIERLLDERAAGGEYLSVEDFLARTKPGKAELLTLIKAGVFDVLEPRRTRQVLRYFQGLEHMEEVADIASDEKRRMLFEALGFLPEGDDLDLYQGQRPDLRVKDLKDCAGTLVELAVRVVDARQRVTYGALHGGNGHGGSAGMAAGGGNGRSDDEGAGDGGGGARRIRRRDERCKVFLHVRGRDRPPRGRRRDPLRHLRDAARLFPSRRGPERRGGRPQDHQVRLPEVVLMGTRGDMSPWYSPLGQPRASRDVSPYSWVPAGDLGMLFAVNNDTEVDMSGYRFSAYVIRDIEGWVAVCPEFPDCRALGATYEQALDNLRDVIRIYVEDGLGDDEPVPQHDGALVHDPELLSGPLSPSAGLRGGGGGAGGGPPERS